MQDDVCTRMVVDAGVCISKPPKLDEKSIETDEATE